VSKEEIAEITWQGNSHVTETILQPTEEDRSLEMTVVVTDSLPQSQGVAKIIEHFMSSPQHKLFLVLLDVQKSTCDTWRVIIGAPAVISETKFSSEIAKKIRVRIDEALIAAD